MRNLVLAALAAVFVAGVSTTVAAQAPAATSAVTQGKMIYAANGQRVAPVYRVTASGDAQVIMNGRLVTIPASTLSDVGGKLTTSLARKEIGAAK